MGERDAYTAGTFCWADLGTTDAAEARAFYTGLFGWEPEDLPAGEGGVYIMFRLGGRDVAALYEMGEAESSQLSAHWSSYVSVDDVAAAAVRAAELGATVVAEPFDVMDSGRMAVLRDPTGAHVHLWQPGRHVGAGRVNEPGAMVWNELGTHDVERAAAFYRDLLGWQIETDDTGYATIRNGGEAGGVNGGIRPLRDGETPSWLLYFSVTGTLEAAAEAVRGAGGELLVEPAAAAVGRIAVVRDPQGATLALYEGEVDP
jgi:predicted enzyme related to lactoylglutathione lyase